MNIGQRVKEAREDLGMQATVLARRVGVAPNTIYRIETGDRTPSVALLEKIARELRTEPANLFKEPVPLDEASETGPLDELDVAIKRQGAAAQRSLEEFGNDPSPLTQARMDREFDKLKKLKARRHNLRGAPEALARIVERLDEPTQIIYLRKPTAEKRRELLSEHPDAIEVEAWDAESVFAEDASA
jgi:transcriptional regulator with XRE-family HTH domain